MRYLFTFLFFVATTKTFADPYKKFTQAEGFSYLIHTKTNGVKAMEGDKVSYWICYKSLKKQIISTTFNQTPGSLVVEKASMPGDINDLLKVMSAGDSATFLVSAASTGTVAIANDNPAKMLAIIKVKSITTAAELAKIEAEKKRIEAEKLRLEEENSYTQSSRGFKYKIYTPNTGAKAKPGDVLFINFRSFTETDSMLDNTFKPGEQPLQIQVQQSRANGDFMDAITILASGDSASFKLRADSLFKGSQLPAFCGRGSYMKFLVKVESIIPADEVKKIQAEKAEKDKLNAKQQASSISDYIKKNNLKAVKTASGLYVVTENPGKGPHPQAGQKVKVHYTGYLLNGKKFDSSVDRGQPFEFNIGKGEVIKGWDEGIAMFGAGGKGKLIIPPYLGYGEQGAGEDIPPGAVLIFDIELISFE